jgi:thiol-disulfide isomerase/thioredoxin
VYFYFLPVSVYTDYFSPMTTKLLAIAILVLLLALMFSEASLGEKMTSGSSLPRAPSQLPRSFVGGSEPDGATLPGGVSRTLTLHYAPWCGACTNYRPAWEQLKAQTTIRGLYFQENNEVANPTSGITSYPTITALDEWGRTHVFRGDRSAERIIEWVSAPVIVG